jgi:uncharacterized protein YciI
MIIIDLKYIKPLAMVEKHLQEHCEFLKKYYRNDVFLMSGPKHPRTGGIIVAKGDFAMMREIIKEDPFYQNQIAEYNLMEFDAIESANVISAFSNQKVQAEII